MFCCMQEMLRGLPSAALRIFVGCFSRNHSTECCKSSGLWSPAVIAVLCLTAFLGRAQINLVQNGSFETGDFTGWTLSGDTSGLQVSIAFPYDGFRSAVFGSPDTFGYIAQNLSTIAGQRYLLSFWVWNGGGTPNALSVQWGSATVLNQQVSAEGWTNMQFSVTASNSTTELKFGAWNEASYTSLDDVRLRPPGGVLTNATPVLPSIGPQTVNELAVLTVTNKATSANPD